LTFYVSGKRSVEAVDSRLETDKQKKGGIKKEGDEREDKRTE